MKLFVIKTINGLIPASRDDFELLADAKLKLNECYEVEIKKKRNIGFHRKFFALLNICFDNQDSFDSIDILRDYLTMKAGFFVKTKTPTGEFYSAKSISFSSMDNIEFQDYYDKIFTQVLKLLDCKIEYINEQLKDF